MQKNALKSVREGNFDIESFRDLLQVESAFVLLPPKNEEASPVVFCAPLLPLASLKVVIFETASRNKSFCCDFSMLFTRKFEPFKGHPVGPPRGTAALLQFSEGHPGRPVTTHGSKQAFLL